MDVVTGAFGYIGKYITKELLAQGRPVRTITTHPGKPNPFGSSVQAFPYSFDKPERMTEALVGTETLYNTYWIRFPFDGQTYESALINTRTLFESARKAGVKKVVHVGVTRATVDSPLPYYRGKAIQETILKESGLPFVVVRPTLVFGDEDILVNNIAWLIRKCPVFPIFGSGRYRVQPVFVGDLAGISVKAANETSGTTLDAIGPETYTYAEFVRHIAVALGIRRKFIHVPPMIGIAAGRAIGWALNDVILTRNELKGLMREMLTSDQPANGSTAFSQWIKTRRNTLGAEYSSEVARHFRWSAS